MSSNALKCGLTFVVCAAGGVVSSKPLPLYAQGGGDAQYQTRPSQCRHEPPPGTPLAIRRSDSGVSIRGYTAERVLTHTADARALAVGDVLVCTEYGTVEIIDSDDDLLRLQIRVEGFGEGSDRPAEAAAQRLMRRAA